MNVFKITVQNNTTNYIEKFQTAFDEIFSLTKLLCDSKNKIIQDYISQKFEEDDPDWLSYDSSKPGIIIFTERGNVYIEKQDYLLHAVTYDFGKRLPADDMFLCAVMSIFKYHLPLATIGDEAEPFYEEFDDGTYLARLINPYICNPYTESSGQPLLISNSAKKIYNALKK